MRTERRCGHPHAHVRSRLRGPLDAAAADKIERRDGSRGTYAFVEKPDFALVIPAENDGFHLVEEFRYPIGGAPGRSRRAASRTAQTGHPAELARLELLQETGLRARHLVKLGFLNCAHGISSQGGHFFLATGLEPGTPEREHEEQDMRQEWVPRAKFEEMISRGRHYRRFHRRRLRPAPAERTRLSAPG